MIKHIDKRIIINGYITIHISGGEHHQGEITISISIPTIKDIILDFFSGSATTAQAVIEQNEEDHGTRKYILVQIEEKCDPDGEAFKAGFKTICEIGKERIRRAGKQILSAGGGTVGDVRDAA